MLPGVSLTNILNNIDGIEKAYELFLNDFTIYVINNCRNIPDNYSFETMNKELLLFLNTLDLQDPSVIGVSIGGMKALNFACDYPDIFKKMVIVASCCKTNDKRLETIKKWDQLASNYEIEKLNLSFFQCLLTDDGFKHNYENIKKTLNKCTREECEEFSLLLRTMDDFDITNKIKNININTLAIGGENDPIFGEEATKEISNYLNCLYYIFKGYRHAFYDEAPDYKQRVYDFLIK